MTELGPLDPAAPTWTRRSILAAGLAAGAFVACGGRTVSSTPTVSPTPTVPVTIAATSTATAIPANATATVFHLPTATPALPGPEHFRPIGFPIDPLFVLGRVNGDVGARAISWGEGPGALAYSRDDQPSNDPMAANRCGWNARVHVEYEGRPAVDWYIPPGTPVRATMDGEATLYVITVSNAFDEYGVSREPYIGNPDRSRAPLNAFPGPGGGMGVFVRVEGEGYRSDYAHLQLLATARMLPKGALFDGVSADERLVARFTPLRDYRDWTALARWQVTRGNFLGFSGDSGYSEAPHLHYALATEAGSPLCPTSEPGIADGGWLFRNI